MKLCKKVLAIGTIIVSLGFMGCGKDIEGRVKEEFGNAQSLVESGRALSKEEQTNATYGLIITSEQKEYIIEIKNHYTKPIVLLARAIKPGDIVRIRDTGCDCLKIGKDGIGTVQSNYVELVEKSEKF
jgi:hypothetical protein